MVTPRKPYPLLKEDWQPCKYCSELIHEGERVVYIPINRWQMSYGHPKCHLDKLKSNQKELEKENFSDSIMKIIGFKNAIIYVEQKIVLEVVK